MKDINIRWVKNAKTKDSSFDLVDRQAYNDYPKNTATVELIGVRQKFPEAKVWFLFPSKQEIYNCWDYDAQKANKTITTWHTNLQVNMIYNETNKDYDIYILFPSGKYNSPLLNFQELDCFYDVIKRIKTDLNNLLTTSNFS